MTISSLVLFSQSRSCTDAVLSAILAAGPLEAADLVAAWQPVYGDIVVPSMRVAANATDFAETDTPVIYSETIDDPGALAYHYQQNDIPYAVIWCPPDATPDEITERTAHELAEMVVDPSCDLYDGDGWAIETADALEGIVRYRDTPEGRVRVCAWNTPAWFKLGADGPYDNAGACSSAHQVLLGGYAQRSVDGQLVQLPPGMRLPPHKLGPHARRAKRARRARGNGARR